MLKNILITSIITFVSLVILFYIFQRNLIYLPNKNIPSQKTYHAQDMQMITLFTQDHLTLQSWYKPAKTHQPTLLYLHGNAGNIGNRMTIVRPLLQQGYGVLLLEYRGYGGNPGQPTEQGLYQDARAALDFLHTQNISPEHIILFGESLGTGVATQIATETQVCAIILQTPYTTLTNVAHFHYPWLKFIRPWDKFNSLNKIQSIQAPLLVLHGTADKVVPYSEGKDLFDKALEPKVMLTFQNREHHNLWQDPQFLKGIVQFIRIYCN